MKNLATFIILFLLISCKNEKEVTIKKDESPKTIETKIDDSKLNEFAELFEGLWMPKKYLKKVSEIKSVFMLQDEIPYISELRISKKSLKNDTLIIGSAVNNHEGYSFKVWSTNHNDLKEFDNNLSYNFKEKYYFTYSVEPDTIITITSLSNSGNTKIKTQYEKISKNIKDYGGEGYNYIAKKELLNGEFEVLDNEKNKLGDFVFEPKTGKIKGFEYEFYFIPTDYNANPGYPSDHVILRHNSEDFNNQKYLSIIKENDTIKLYDSKEIDSDAIFEFDLAKLNYYLIRKNY